MHYLGVIFVICGLSLTASQLTPVESEPSEYFTQPLDITNLQNTVEEPPSPAFLEMSEEEREISPKNIRLLVLIDLAICVGCFGLVGLTLHLSNKMKLRWLKLNKNYEKTKQIDVALTTLSKQA
mmetsp:Transcript_3788/g.8065  ORF Transcript_3788/g.8065 Transcript_3788/m.8065 type:complete len:124 (-) Transcript_3788:134-505(-)